MEKCARGSTQIVAALETTSPATAFAEGPPEPSRCAVCGDQLREIVILDVFSIEDGDEFRLTCNTVDQAHNEHVVRRYEVHSGVRTTLILKHVGNKPWTDPVRVFEALWPWLRRAMH